MIVKIGWVEGGKVYCLNEGGMGKWGEDNEEVGLVLLFLFFLLISWILCVLLFVFMMICKLLFLLFMGVKIKFLICIVFILYFDIFCGIDILRDF